MTIRAIDPAGFRPPAAHSPGPAPSLLWIPVDQLVIDEAYQRRITKAGRAAVQAIVDHFAWPMFSPVIVAPVEGGKYAVIDGQHRTTAAAVCGVEQVPCQVVQADQRQQAASFAAVNGKVLKISTMTVYHAAVAADEAWAAGVADVCAAANVTVLRYPMPAHSRYRPRHSTMSIRPIEEMIAKHGRDHAIRVLRVITTTEVGDDPNVLGRVWITAISTVLAERTDHLNDNVRLLAFFNALDAGACFAEARKASGYGISQTEALTVGLRVRLTAALDAKEAA